MLQNGRWVGTCVNESAVLPGNFCQSNTSLNHSRMPNETFNGFFANNFSNSKHSSKSSGKAALYACVKNYGAILPFKEPAEK
jgi:hypothetical protein